ncbi:MAG: M20/M25/M40 family metallo-hydrolase [Alphaproteobacteria bacterium]|nr:M20/M25/M40 family metallo-hydrolase [Alphaproteobacteria bacterium]
MTKDRVNVENIVAFAQEMIRTPSRAYEDDPENIVGVIQEWADQHSLHLHLLEDPEGRSLGGYFHYTSGKPGPVICLDACVDTCSFGAEETWDYPPTSAKIEGDHLHGRGAADAKTGASIFCHIFEEITKQNLDRGEVYVLLDADEHTGNFGGVKAFLKKQRKIDMAFLGYPGNKEIFLGARGFLRSTISVYGQGAHSGSRKPTKDNALLRTAQLISMISEAPLPEESSPDFPFGPKVTVTAINGGEGFSQVPDKVEINVDMRLTPGFDRTAGNIWLRKIVENFDASHPGSPPSAIAYNESWPCYALPHTHPAAAGLKEQAEKVFSHPVSLAVCGPSNIGNLLAEHNIPTICGFGVDYANAHGANETARISSIEPVYTAYYNTIKTLCS